MGESLLASCVLFLVKQLIWSSKGSNKLTRDQQLFRNHVTLYILSGNRFTGENHEAFNYISEFANVASPIVILQHFDGIVINCLFGDTIICADVGQELINERRNVIFSLI